MRRRLACTDLQSMIPALPDVEQARLAELENKKRQTSVSKIILIIK